ncbi:MAG: diguanylate cyclase [Myxococcales bacterium]|nr:diguanylate cyclase [Myxococcales bacterium]
MSARSRSCRRSSQPARPPTLSPALHGHQGGDDALVAVARVLASRTRSTDLLARYGGEEVCVLFPYLDEAQAASLAEDLRESVR